MTARSLVALVFAFLVWAGTQGALAEAEPSAAPTDAEEQFQLGRRLVWGLEGTKKDERAGVEWLRKAAEQGHPRAQTQLAMAYQKGRGVGRDVEESVKWMRKAADQGQAKAQFELGVYYRDGKGVPKDRILGLMWLLLGQEKGGIAARIATPGLLRQLKPRDRKEAWELVYQWREAHGLPRIPPRAEQAKSRVTLRGGPAHQTPADSQTGAKAKGDETPTGAAPQEGDDAGPSS